MNNDITTGRCICCSELTTIYKGNCVKCWSTCALANVMLLAKQQPLPDPPPKPDAFEEWWRAHVEKHYAEDYDPIAWLIEQPIRKGISKDLARIVWDAALASKP